MSDGDPRPLGAWRLLAFHLAPGLAISVFAFVLAALFRPAGIPSYFFLELAILTVAPALMLFFMRRTARAEGLPGPAAAVAFRGRLAWWKTALLALAAFAWAALVMTLAGRTVTPAVKEALFPWWPDWMDLADYLLRPAEYSRGWVVATWAFGILATGILGPLFEEIYFRGFLLPRIGGSPLVAVLVGILLFSAYHLFSPWMLPARFVALLPLVYITLRTRSLGPAILAHVLLNICGDSLGSIGLVFGK